MREDARPALRGGDDERDRRERGDLDGARRAALDEAQHAVGERRHRQEEPEARRGVGGEPGDQHRPSPEAVGGAPGEVLADHARRRSTTP